MTSDLRLRLLQAGARARSFQRALDAIGEASLGEGLSKLADDLHAAAWRCGEISSTIGEHVHQRTSDSSDKLSETGAYS